MYVTVSLALLCAIAGHLTPLTRCLPQSRLSIQSPARVLLQQFGISNSWVHHVVDPEYVGTRSFTWYLRNVAQLTRCAVGMQETRAVPRY